jgi:serine/threonine protein kinase/TolB-like protein/cytochrome c-type biogenesis protein CcmH/NrfG
MRYSFAVGTKGMSSPDSRAAPFMIAVGARMGAYEIVGPLGAGGMGEVYRARDTRLGREVALKLIHLNKAQDQRGRDRIEHEARIVASLNHPNILALHDIGTADGTMYIVTELVDGESLRGAMPPLRKSLDIAAQIADGLAASHAAGITHRDLKPDNVMVTRDGRVKLLDFGIAIHHRSAPDIDATTSQGETGLLTGTIGYMAPEQVRASDDVDFRADIFSLGALLYELITGTPAFQGDTAADVMAAVLTADPPALPLTVPAAVRDIVHRCLEKNREQRFQSARDLGFVLRQAAAVGTVSDATHPRPVDPPSPAAIRQHLAKLLSDSSIAGAERLSGLLRFVVEETLNERQNQLKETRIGLDVFGRKADSYDPAFDPIVRVQMGRLRAKLRAYYNGPGRSDDVRIDVPVGSYVPAFTTAVARTHTASEPGPSSADDQRIAVLPIVNMSADGENQYFCDGLTEELINHLAQIPQLRVVARTSSFQFKDAARDIRKVGRLLDVSKVLEGSVRKSGNRIRVTVQLINVADGCHLWSERYESDLSDIFAIHENISTAVQRSLQRQVLGTDSGGGNQKRPQRIDAYNLYLQGRFQWKKRTEQGLRTALDHFQEAARLEPAFARALSGVADCYLMLGMSAAKSPDHCMPRAAEAARLALQLDDSLAEAHASLAAVHNCYDWNLRAAEQGYRRAIELDPSYATALHWLGMFRQATSGRFAEAVDSLEQAIELDPLSPPIIADLGLAHAFGETFDAAAMYCRQALSLEAHFHRPYWFLGLTNAWSGNFQAAEDALTQGLELCPGMAFRARLLGALGFVYGRWGKKQLAQTARLELERMRQTSYMPSFELAQIETGLGNYAGALACLEHAVVHRESYAIFLKAWNTFAPLRQQPRFRALVAQIGLD